MDLVGVPAVPKDSLEGAEVTPPRKPSAPTAVRGAESPTAPPPQGAPPRAPSAPDRVAVGDIGRELAADLLPVAAVAPDSSPMPSRVTRHLAMEPTCDDAEA